MIYECDAGYKNRQSEIRNLNLKNITASPALCFGCSKKLVQKAYLRTANKPAITAKRATPSTNAAVRIIFARMSLDASG